jgi:hypothetical protein
MLCDSSVFMGRKQRFERRLVQFLHPPLMGFPFVAALPIDVGLVAEAAGEKSEELAPAP